MTKMGSWATGTMLLTVLLGCATTSGGGTASTATTSAAATEGSKKSLYDRLGGVEAIKAVVDDFINRQAADPRMTKFYAKTDTAYLKGQISDFLCEVTGGPCKYTGMSMPDAHEGREIQGEHWNGMVENLVASLNKFKVPEQEQQELLAAASSLKDQIVAKH